MATTTVTPCAMTDDSLTARNRINQRNFRARRQNYIKELEERIRKYESEGVQATIEIQAAARQVTDQNTKLRSLLTQHFGMSEHDLSNYLGLSHQSSSSSSSPALHGQLFPSPNSELGNLALAASDGPLPSSPSIWSDSCHAYPTPPRQLTEAPRTLTSAQLDPAISLASLHKFPLPTGRDPRNVTTLMSSCQNSDSSMTNQSVLYSSGIPNSVGPPSDSPTDTLSESSNPTTPAEQMQTDHHGDRHTICQSLPAVTTIPATRHHLTTDIDTDTRTERTAPRAPNDETSCEEAARIIASMRGVHNDNPDQVMLELGCSDPQAKCHAKNLKIFQLIDQE